MEFADRIGLKVFDFSYFLTLPQLKRDLLYFDKLLIDEAHYKSSLGFAHLLCQRYNHNSNVLSHLENELKFLNEQGLVEFINYQDLPYTINPADSKALQAISKAESEAEKYFEQQTNNKLSDMERFDASTSWLVYNTKALLLKARMASTQYISRDCQYVPFLSGTLQQHLIEFDIPQAVLRLILDYIPIPSKNTSWEKILDFKADPDSREKLFRLRKWISNIGASAKSLNDVQNNLEAALADYKSFLLQHKIEHERGALEAIVVCAAEVLENIATLKLSKALGVFFKVFKEDHALTKAELSAPGREVAYIEKVENSFEAK
jgi:hypothetical protein